MADTTYDQLAQILREMRERFGEDAFSNRRRLTGLLADRLPDAKLEIRVVLDAIDDGVIGELANASRDQLGMQIDRLGSRLESRRGIRSDIARGSVAACAYALGLGPLPSQFDSATRGLPIPPAAGRSNDWVGVSEVVGGSGGRGPELTSPEPGRIPAQAKSSIFNQPAVRLGAGILVSIAVGAIGVRFFTGEKPVVPPQSVERPRELVAAPEVRPPEVRRDRAPERSVPPPRSEQGPDRQGTLPADRPPASRPAQPQSAGAPLSVPPGGFAEEARDFGVPATSKLQTKVGSPTPASIPGARIASTVALATEIANGSQLLLIDVLSDAHAQTLPGAIGMAGAGNPGSFDDAIQRQFAQALQRITGGRKEVPVILFCSGPSCWYSYNASLRAVAAGYTNVFWYRGGIAAWRAAGQSLAPLSR